MARVELAPGVLDDFDRFFDPMESAGTVDAPPRVAEIVDAVELLAHSPLVGRKTKGGKRELVIGRGSRGYVALYRYEAAIDAVFVLAIRHQREAGYRD